MTGKEKTLDYHKQSKNDWLRRGKEKTMGVETKLSVATNANIVSRFHLWGKFINLSPRFYHVLCF
jgi:hypothetical protein